MSKLALIKSANSLRDLAILLGYQPSALSFIVHKIPDAEKYAESSVPKKTGGVRTIRSPCPKLKEVQKRLSEFLYGCIDELNMERMTLNPKFKDTLVHGFYKGRSIMTNATPHRNKKVVLNLDLEDFFGSINFGRVRGYFIGSKDFTLSEAVATVIAKICCFDNSLPQGAPTSPVVSNLIGRIFDLRVVQLASKYGVHYTRYADDLTFSTNEVEFPKELVRLSKGKDHWLVGRELKALIERSGFKVNAKKTRVQFRISRQDVTGLVVNSRVNTPSEYRRLARAMAHRLFMTGKFERVVKEIDVNGKVVERAKPGTLDQLTGVFSYIVGVDEYERQRQRDGGSDKEAKLPMLKVFGELLFYRHFYANEKPVIICEGKTDITYLRCAIRGLASEFPVLAQLGEEGNISLNVSFFNCSAKNANYLELNGGADQLRSFLSSYMNRFNSFKAQASLQPLIILIDNDSGARKIYSLIKQLTASKAEIKGDEPVYNVYQKVYVVPTPKINGKDSKIEDFFPAEILAEKLEGKSFNSENVELSSSEYGKHYFAEYIIKPKRKNIDYSLFRPMLKTISDIIAVREEVMSGAR